MFDGIGRTIQLRIPMALILILSYLPVFGETNSVEQNDDLEVVPLALPVISSVEGFGVAGLSILTRPGGPGEDFEWQSVIAAAITDRDTELLHLELEIPALFSLPLRLKTQNEYTRSPNQSFLGYGNFHPTNRLNRIASGEAPLDQFHYKKPLLYQTDGFGLDSGILQGNSLQESLTPGKNYFQEKQNRFFSHSEKRLSNEAYLEGQIFNFPIYWIAGLTSDFVQIDPSGMDRDRGEMFSNEKSHLERTKPPGSDALNRTRLDQGVVTGLFLNTIPSWRGAHPDSGFKLGVTLQNSSKNVGGNYNYSRLGFQFEKHTALFESFLKDNSQELILSFRLRTYQTWGSVPFFQEMGLGGKTLRGVQGNYWIDRTLVFGSMELRHTFARLKEGPGELELAWSAFLDGGRVAPSPDTLDTRGWHGAAGIGLSLISGKNATLELVYGRSVHGEFFELNVGHSFDL